MCNRDCHYNTMNVESYIIYFKSCSQIIYEIYSYWLSAPLNLRTIALDTHFKTLNWAFAGKYEAR